MVLQKKRNSIEKRKLIQCRIEQSLMEKVERYGADKHYQHQSEAIRDLLYIAFSQIEGKSEIKELKELFIKETKKITDMIRHNKK